jgi:pimeloyl-ACP methyl ester carboxylesterase
MTPAIVELSANGFTFRCRRAGDSGEPVMLLHGFPELSVMWRGLMSELSGAGYRCLAPDQRGYSPGARPSDVASYDLDLIAGDVVALADAAGFGRFHLIGHDWGSAAGWNVLRLFPQRVASWTAMSVAHLASYAAAYQSDPEQQRKGAYIADFLQPGRTEARLSANDFAELRKRYAIIAPDAVEDYAAWFSQPGALTAALNWYRANFGGARGALFEPFDVHVPTLTLWGNRDPAIARSTTLKEKDYMKGPYRIVELDAEHWLIQELPDQCTREILAHLRAHPLVA